MSGVELQDGHTYIDGRGNLGTVGGATRDYPGWVWTIQGFWYERSTGRRVGYIWNRATGEVTRPIQPDGHLDNFVREVQS